MSFKKCTHTYTPVFKTHIHSSECLLFYILFYHCFLVMNDIIDTKIPPSLIIFFPSVNRSFLLCMAQRNLTLLTIQSLQWCSAQHHRQKLSKEKAVKVDKSGTERGRKPQEGGVNLHLCPFLCLNCVRVLNSLIKWLHNVFFSLGTRLPWMHKMEGFTEKQALGRTCFIFPYY